MSSNTMSHEEAVSTQAAERYVLCELTQDEREAFEGHYFDCSACFDQVKLGGQFLRHAREVLDPEPEKGWLATMLADLRRPAPAFAMAMLLALGVGVGVLEHGTIAELRAPKVEMSQLLKGPARGSSNTAKVSRNVPLRLYVEVARNPEFVSYEAQLVEGVDGSGSAIFSLPIALSQLEGDKAPVTVLPDTLHAGQYSLRIFGVTQTGHKSEAGLGILDLQFKD